MKVPAGSMRQLTKQTIPKDFKRQYHKNLVEVRKIFQPFEYVQKTLRYDAGYQKEYYVDYECLFAAECIKDVKPKRIVDIGSYRHFILGLLAHHELTSIDVRRKKIRLENEIAITCDARRTPLESNSFDLVLSLSSIEHFGLGRYGDDFDLSGDMKAIAEFTRILKPNGYIIFSVPITGGKPFIAFNAHRVYDIYMVKKFFREFELVESKYYSFELNDYCSFEQITDKKNKWDIYMGCFKK